MIQKKIVIGITCASGAIYAENLINRLHQQQAQIAGLGIVLTENAIKVRQHELGLSANSFAAGKIYNNNDFFAPFASGSSRYDVMIICPCSMGTLGRIAHGYADDLISRTADVMLKEKKTLILLLREMPFNLVHIENIRLLCHAGATICPASPSFYSKPQNIEELINTVTNKLLLLAGFEIKSFEWGNEP